jgi:DNA-binding transcriptional MerR regulator
MKKGHHSKKAAGGGRAWTLRELAAEAGLPPRTVRYYIARGLLAGPVKAGRGAAYGAEHRARLGEIADRQRGGASLAEIAARLARETGAAPLAARRCLTVELAPDVRAIFDETTSPWRRRRIQRALAEARRILEQTDDA